MTVQLTARSDMPIEESKLLVLDLDETLMFASMFRLPTAADFQLGLAQAVRRPGLGPFLARCFALFRVAVWTSATEEYAEDALCHLLPAGASLAFVWCRNKCSRVTDPVLHDSYWAKNAGLLLEEGHVLDSLLVLDDEPRSWGAHSDRVLTVPKFRGDPADTVLTGLLPVMSAVAEAADIRTFLREPGRPLEQDGNSFP